MAMASLPPNISTRPITWMTTLYIALCLSLGAGQGPGQGSAATPPRGIHNSETVLGDPVTKDLAMRGNAYDLLHPRAYLLDSTNTTAHSDTNRVIYHRCYPHFDLVAEHTVYRMLCPKSQQLLLLRIHPGRLFNWMSLLNLIDLIHTI